MMLNNKTMKQANKSMMLVILGCIMLFMSIISTASAQQTGASLQNVSTSTKPSVSPQYNNQSKGSINTLILTGEQQNSKWKAYVGNVSSTFVLDDANDYSIYQWTMDSFSGQVYITTSNAITWSTVSCASSANKLTEDTAVSHNSTSADSVNRTFSSQVHKAFTLGSTNVLQSTCYSTVTWQNDANHQLNTTAPWQEVLLWDTTSSKMIYTVFVENDKVGYRADGTTYDFQAIVPDDGVASNPALRYYFYLELS